MYYFEILEVLKDAHNDWLSAFDIYLILKTKQECNILNIRRQLKKMYLKNPQVERELINDPERPFSRRGYVYQLRYIKQ